MNIGIRIILPPERLKIFLSVLNTPLISLTVLFLSFSSGSPLSSLILVSLPSTLFSTALFWRTFFVTMATSLSSEPSRNVGRGGMRK